MSRHQPSRPRSTATAATLAVDGMASFKRERLLDSPAPFVEIETLTRLYRFYGLGKWKILCIDGEWHPINAICVPRDALRIAASQCSDRVSGERS